MRIVNHKNSKVQPFDKAVSIIVCAKNEASNLEENLPFLLKQAYSLYEVVVVDDDSDDNTQEVLKSLKATFLHLKVLKHQTEDVLVGKKQALAFGIKHCSYDYVLLTDADCKAASPLWLKHMAGHFNTKDIVLGFGPLYKESSVINRIQRWETLHTAVQYLAFAKWGFPYMGVGRNLAYKKDVFLQSKQFENHKNIPSGDDDLFVKEVAHKNNVAIELAEKAFTYSKAKSSFKAWWLQKQRHLSTSIHYTPLMQVWLGVYGLSQLLFYVLPFVAFAAFINTPFVGWLIALKLGLQYVLFLPMAKSLQSKEVLLLLPLWEILQVVVSFLIHIQNTLWGKSKKWS